jgi:hypothetical protein
MSSVFAVPGRAYAAKMPDLWQRMASKVKKLQITDPFARLCKSSTYAEFSVE